MKLRKIFIILGILVFVCGCTDSFMICSLNPFYLEKNITLLSEVEGNWEVHPLRAKSDTTPQNHARIWQLTDTIHTWQIKQFITEEKIKTPKDKDSIVFKPQKFYLVKLAYQGQDSAQYQYKMVLFRLNNILYADFFPYELITITNSRMSMENFLPVHTLARIIIKDKQFKVSWLGTEYMKDMIEKKRVRIKYRYVQETSRLMLTASSEELTNMIERYADQTRFIDWDDQLAMLKLTPIKPMP